MATRKRFIIFTTLISLTFFIFTSSTILGKYITFESKVVAETTGDKTPLKIHALKTIDVQFKESNQLFLEKRNQKIVFLTFDDGPTEHTLAILDILNKYNAPSTFFMLKGNIVKRPNVVKEVADSGHSIGCHGVSHKVNLFYKTATSPKDEMDSCSKSVAEVVGKGVELIRVPFGSFPHLTSTQKENLAKSQFILWDWNVDSMDWNIQSPDQMVSIVMKQVEKLENKEKVPVILFHDKEITVMALPKIIENLKALGYEISPLSVEVEPLQFKTKN